ncbi:MAG TPA: intermembrane transport protein PqiB [Pantoea sp.]|nr:intermembrane transport protein PqiB [Pantoea sp.]
MKNSDTSAVTLPPSRGWVIWIIPLLTLLAAAAMVVYHFSHQGAQITLITDTAEGIKAGNTPIKNRSIIIGEVETTALAEDLRHVEIKLRLHPGMEKLLHRNSMFWLVKPQIGHEGITGLSTLMSGAYIALQPGDAGSPLTRYSLLDAPPLASVNAQGIRVILNSQKKGQLQTGDPVMFSGFRVGSVESSRFDTQRRGMTYRLFIASPYDRLVTNNTRFWQTRGINVGRSASGLRVESDSVVSLLSGGVSFAVPSGWEPGRVARNNAEYPLFDDRQSTERSYYTRRVPFLLLFTDSVRGLKPGAPVEFRGIRLGTVIQVPFVLPGRSQNMATDYRVPVLINLEPDRFVREMPDFNLVERLKSGIARGMRATLRTSSLLSGALYIDLDFLTDVAAYTGPKLIAGYEIIPTAPGGLNQLQQKLVSVLDKVNHLPLTPLVLQTSATLKQSQRTMVELQQTVKDLNQLTASPAMQTLPVELQHALRELNSSLKGLQPGSLAYDRLVGNMQRLDQVLRDLQSLLKLLNRKSNALVADAATQADR